MLNPLSTPMLQHDLALSPVAIERLLKQKVYRQRRQRQFDSLTSRQREILTLICKGKTNRQIGQQLFISEDTVRTHRNNIWKQVGIRSAVEAVWFGQAFDLV